MSVDGGGGEEKRLSNASGASGSRKGSNASGVAPEEGGAGSEGRASLGEGSAKGSGSGAGGGGSAARVSFGEGSDKGGGSQRGSYPGEYEGEGEGEIGEDAGSGLRGSQGSGAALSGEVGDTHAEDCNCIDCVCPEEPAKQEQEEQYPLDEFMRAKAYFQQVSGKSGLNMYDHLSDVIRKFLDDRAPNNPVDYLEEVSMNVKRYRFGLKKDEDTLQNAFFTSDTALQDSKRLLEYWRQFAGGAGDAKPDDSGPGGSFQNLLRLQYYLEQVNIGLSKEEMFRVALGIKDLTGSRSQIERLRFWGKIFGSRKNYYVIEAETKGEATDVWAPGEDDAGEIGEGRTDGCGKCLQMDSGETFNRAKDVVLNQEILQQYVKSSGLSPDKVASLLPQGQSNKEWSGEGGGQPVEFEYAESRADAMKWEGYQQELMQNFPQPKAGGDVVAPAEEIPAEPDGSGVNRRAFYVCSDLGADWACLPAVTPQQINASRSTRWYLSGDLNSSVKSIPPFPGKEGHYLKALLVRITAGGMCSPKGFYKARGADGEVPGEEDDEEFGPEDDEPIRTGNDTVQPTKKYQVEMSNLTNGSFWVHHTSCILTQGRTTWFNTRGSKSKRGASFDGSEMEDEEDDEDEEDEEIDAPGKEQIPPLFRSIGEDIAPDGRSAWSVVQSSSCFPEHQVVGVRSNVWTGSNAICTCKGKVSNAYFGDGLKFAPVTFYPPLSDVPSREYKAGPELQESQDPSVEDEQSWLEKLALNENDEADKGEYEEGEEEEEEEEETENEY